MASGNFVGSPVVAVGNIAGLLVEAVGIADTPVAGVGIAGSPSGVGELADSLVVVVVVAAAGCPAVVDLLGSPPVLAVHKPAAPLEDVVLHEPGPVEDVVLHKSVPVDIRRTLLRLRVLQNPFRATEYHRP